MAVLAMSSLQLSIFALVFTENDSICRSVIIEQYILGDKKRHEPRKTYNDTNDLIDNKSHDSVFGLHHYDMKQK